MTKLKVALIGYGHLGKWHAQKIAAHHSRVEFFAIVEKNPLHQEEAKKNFPSLKVVSELSEVIENIEAAFIVTPTVFHAEIVLELLAKRKHIFCEKPLCSNDHEAQMIREKIKTISPLPVIQVGHSERFHEAWELLESEIRALPHPLTVTLSRYAPFKGRATDVDVVQDLAIHDLDLLLFLFETKIVSLRAKGHKIRTHHFDHVTIMLNYENGTQAQIIVGRNSVREKRELEIISSQGNLTVDLFHNKILRAKGLEQDSLKFVEEQSYSKRDHLYLEHQFFYDSVLSHQKIIVTLEDGLRAVHLVDCVLKSLETDKEVKVSFE